MNPRPLVVVVVVVVVVVEVVVKGGGGGAVFNQATATGNTVQLCSNQKLAV